MRFLAVLATLISLNAITLATLLLTRQAPLSGPWAVLLDDDDAPTLRIDYLHLPTDYQFTAFTLEQHIDPDLRLTSNGERLFARLRHSRVHADAAMLRDYDWYSLGWHGRGERLLINRSGLDDAFPSPDGRWLAWRAFDPAAYGRTPLSVIMLSADGDTMHRIGFPPDISTLHQQMRWSTDGRFLYVLGYQDATAAANPVARVFRVAAGSADAAPYRDLNHDTNAFVLDADTIYTVTNHLHIDRYTPDTDAPQRLFSGVGSLMQLWRTPDGAVMTLEWRREIGTLQFVSLTDADGPGYVNIFSSHDPTLNWNASRDRLAQMSSVSGQRALLVMNARGDRLKRLPLSRECSRQAWWLGDTEWVVVEEVLGGQCHLVALHTVTATRQPLISVDRTSPHLRSLDHAPLLVPDTETVVLSGSNPRNMPVSYFIDLRSGDITRQLSVRVSDVALLPAGLKNPHAPWLALALGVVVGVGGGALSSRRPRQP
jgi:hypothetical protein